MMNKTPTGGGGGVYEY